MIHVIIQAFFCRKNFLDESACYVKTFRFARAVKQQISNNPVSWNMHEMPPLIIEVVLAP